MRRQGKRVGPSLHCRHYTVPGRIGGHLAICHRRAQRNGQETSATAADLPTSAVPRQMLGRSRDDISASRDPPQTCRTAAPPQSHQAGPAPSSQPRQLHTRERRSPAWGHCLGCAEKTKAGQWSPQAPLMIWDDTLSGRHGSGCLREAR